MKLVLNWFKKAQKIKVPDDARNPSAVQQGNYTDHVQEPYSKRMQFAPISGDELEAFEWIMNRLDNEHPEAGHKQSALMDWGLDEGWFFVDKEGMLRVTQEPPA